VSGRSPSADRGQLVLLAAAVVAVALVAMVVAYLQVAGPGTAGAQHVVADGEPVERVRAGLEPAVYNASLAAVGVGWAGRSRAATRVGQRLDPAVDRLEAGALPDGRAVSVGRNESVAETWATARCPGGPNRQFGSCEAVDGLVFQARGGEATLVAVAFDVRVTDPQGTRRAGIVVRVP